MQEVLKTKTSLNILKKHARWVSGILRVFDFCLIFISGLLAFFVKFGLANFPAEFYLEAMVLGGLLGLFSFQFLGVYSPLRGRKLIQQLRQLFFAWLLLTLMLSLLAFFTKTGGNFSRQWLFEWMLLGLVLSSLARAGLVWGLSFFRGLGYNTRSIVILGSGELARKMAEKLNQDKSMGYQLVSFLDRESFLKNKNIKEINGIPVLPVPENLEQFIAERNIDEVWIAMPMRSMLWVKKWMHQLRFSTVNIKIIPDIFELNLLNHSIGQIGGIPVINLRSSPMQGLSRVVKSLEDKILASLILLGISPLFIGIAIAVKLSSKGPVFYCQDRYGCGGKTIRVYKFRSMFLHQENAGYLQQASKSDPRITRLGEFLRRTSLDELPQFINVLQGRMSIVGPRPHAVSHNEYYKPLIRQYMQRHMVKPGITGWAQVNGFRGEVDSLEKMEKRIEYDIFYIEHWSLWFDLKIIFLTIFKGFVNKNAY